MKYTHLFMLLLMLVFHTLCGQTQTESHQGHMNYDIKDTVTAYRPNAMVRNVKQGRNGTILFAASRAAVFCYYGKSFTNTASKIGSRRYWDVLVDRYGNLWFATSHCQLF